MIILWWHWLALGLILVALELAASGGFYIIFFGIAAIAIAMLRVARPRRPGLGAAPALLGLSRSGRCSLFRSPLMRWLKLDRPGVDVDSHGRR